MIYLISECHIPANQILVITFTKAAALEMQKRAVSANPACSYVIFGTFHSVFYHILKLSNPNKAYQLAGDKERFLLPWIVLLLIALYWAFFNSSIPFLIRAIDSSFPMISIISVAPAGVICLPETAVRIGHNT